jgi:nondiscriminating aspartyl-tRNA synthetase
MQRTLVSETIHKIGDTVKVSGWVKIKRDHGKISFIDLKDRSGILQCIITPDTKNYEEAKKIKAQWVLKIEGEIKKRPGKLINPDIETGEIEMEVKSFEIIEEALELPIDIAQEEMNLHLETLLDHRNLTIRNEKVGSIFRVYAQILKSYANFMRSQDFLEIKTPKIVYAATEGGANFFKIKYFEDEAYLAQSPQFYKQAGVSFFERVFEIGPVFRAEPHFTSRHVNEYISFDAEMGFIEKYEDLMDMLERVMKEMLSDVKEKCGKELKMHDSELDIPKVFSRLKLSEALEILETKFGKKLESFDIDPEGERLICQWAKEEKDSDFVFLTHYPTSIRPMYAMPDPENLKETLTFDLLYRGVEIATGGQRIHNYEQLINNIKNRGLNPEDFRHYLEMFKYGMPPHGGWGLGSERICQKILGLKSIKEAILFPRDVNRLTP